MARRSIAVVGFLTLGTSLAGCYTLQPARGVTPAVGEMVAFDVNDAGRVALGGSLGPEIAQIEGRVVEHASGEYVLAVSNVTLLRGGQQVWTGEQVRIKSDYVTSTYERRFSRGRTAAISIVGVGLVAYLVTRSIKGSGREDEDTIPIDSAQTQLIPIPNP
jgi:hypothetical protein